MTKLFHPLLALIASASDSHLRRQVRYLKEENQILRARIPGQVHTRREERDRLLKFGLPLGAAIEELISIVTPGTFYRWRREARRGKPSLRKPRGKSQVLRDLVVKIARETGFGYTKILGELRSLGISRICRQTVKNILKAENIEPSPTRRRGTWDDYLKAHAETLWACDFFTKRAVTARGLVDLYVLVFMHLESREVVVYAKLPKSFVIPTPVGNYNPDWAIAFKDGEVKHIYFIAETKGSMSSMDLRKIEECKIDCARKFFAKITSDQVKYDVVDSYGKLMELVK